jgi:hypothetical protein
MLGLNDGIDNSKPLASVSACMEKRGERVLMVRVVVGNLEMEIPTLS